MMSETDRCIKCGSCVRVCPVTTELGESFFPGPRTVAVDAPRFGPDHRSVQDVAWLCSMCERCAQACPSGIQLPLAIRRVRGELYDPARLRPGHARLVQNIDRHGLSVEPAKTALGSRESGSKLAYFPGCIASQRETAVAEGALRLLDSVGIQLDLPSGLVCCGSPLAKLGDEDRRLRCMQQNLKILSRYDQVVTSCPGCTTQLAEDYGLEVMHITEFLIEVVGTKRLKFSTDAPKTKVGLHLSCHLSCGVGPHTIEYTRQLIAAMPNIELIEPEDASICCGAGGSLLSGYPDVAERLAGRKVESALVSGAEVLTAACPFCVMNLRWSRRIDVMELGQLLVSRQRWSGQH